MRRSRRMAAAMSALAVAAGGLVSAAVIGAGPARADHCDPAEATSQAPPRQDGDDQNQGQNDQNQNDQGRNQDQQGRDRDGRDRDRDGRDRFDGFDGFGQGGGRAVLDPAQQPDADDPAQSPDAWSRDAGSRDAQDPDAQNPDAQNPDAQNPDTQNPDAQDPAQSPEPEESASTFSRRGRPTRSATPAPTGSQDPDGTASPTASPSPTGSGDPEECADLGPFPQDFVNIRQVAARRLDARTGRNGSRGSFVSQCGTNRNGHQNSANFIVAPGVENGAHHLHDYVGNLSTDAFSTDESLAAAGTTCRLGDKSTYYWPVIRDRRVDANTGDPDGNVGQVLRPRSATLQFRGNATSRVVAMPRFMRIITGDAKAGTNGGANARAGWSCSGFQNRISPDKYTLCPRGSQVLRILDFPSCWDGQNTDSANHRTHVVFPDQNGACPQGTRAIPALRMTLAYNVPQGPSYAVDAFPEQKHNPITDHGDFVNVMPDRLMQFVVSCINRGRRC
ncbi:DUF1996 domain-containing protein [Nonomuraea phyllanthi]|uniref:DUF1996 domain-containing protein n=1 Tax=Nonomuraea phyllanthi TaxID=2219224 RepID=UPI0021D60826|nr:DUF1996 domain-containing protein [Nonomuraea phyllanthi]